MAQQIQAIRGMNDVLPADISAWQHLEACAREVASSYGYEEIRVPLSEERVDVQKRTVVTEEVEIGKRKVEGTEHVSDTVRHEELRVDDDVANVDDAPLRGR